MSFIANTLPRFGEPLSAFERAFVGKEAPQQVRPFLALWGAFDETPLLSLPEVAAELGVCSVLIKNEGLRLNLGSFKSLGGAYAVIVLCKRLLERRLGYEVAV